MKPTQLAMVGGGGISRAHIAAAKASERGISFAAVIDPNETARRAAAEAAAAKAFESFDAFLSSPEAKTVAGVVVCTPPSARLPIVKAAVARRLGVLMEKPMAHTLADAKSLTDLAAANPKVFSAIGYCHRFTPGIIEMKKRIAAGEIGDVTRFENTFACALEKLKTQWMSDPAVSGGGSFIDTGCHSLDLFLHLMGQGSVVSAIFHRAWPGRGESSATALMRSDRGVAGVIQSGWMEPARFVVAVVGTLGSLRYDYDCPLELHLRRNDGRDERVAVATCDLRFQHQLEAFAEGVNGGEPAIRPATFDEGLQTARWVDQAQRLAAT